MTGRTAIVVGGGIGGLAAARALHLRGWQVTVLERAPVPGEVGAGISLWPNALRALDALGLAGRIRDRGITEGDTGIRQPGGCWLSRPDAAEMTRRYGAVIMLHRADLHRILVDALPPAVLRTGAQVTGVDSDGTVTWGTLRTRADLVVGADGIHSTVRRLVFPDAAAPRYAGYTAWRFVVPGPPGGLAGAGETWGRGTRFGYAVLPDGRVYCYATANTPPGGRAADGEPAELRRRFGGWHAPIPALLRAATDDVVLRHDIHHLPALARFVSERVALLGDAAHAMTPDLGQGACQALEDAVTLAAVPDGGTTVPAGLRRYDEQRRPRTQAIARRSRRTGAVAQWAAAPAALLRDTAVRLTPAPVLLRSFAPVLDWAPPR